jgi:uncharacterized oxidoreductase
MKTTGLNVLVTGGAQGIGLAIAKEFLNDNNNVMICGRNLEKLQKAQSENAGLEITQCDVIDPDQVKQLAATVKEKWGHINVVINNAGVYQSYNFQKNNQPFNVHEQIIDINFHGPIRLINEFLPLLKTQKEAAIINVSSGLAYVPFGEAPVYSASKAGVHSYTISLRHQLKNANTPVKIFELMPPLVDTPMTKGVEGIPKTTPEKVATTLMKGVRKNKYTIRPGQSKGIYFMSRFFPRFIEKQLNKTA